ncbi:hypothetical protein NJF35_24570, partial [Pseudomonas guariconensis]|nr:hypothetical protein [Pseudomonas guariconensis]
LGISSKRVVHHWKKAGGPGQIPGYATHLEEVAKTARYLKYGGYVAIGLGATSSYLKVQEVCRAGETEECRRIRFPETGSFSGGLVGGMAGAAFGKAVISAVCTFGPWGRAICGIALVGGGSLSGGLMMERVGGATGEVVYENLYD